MDIKSLTGLEVMQLMAAGKLPTPSIAETMPMKPVEVSHGYVKFTVIADDRHINPLGGIHGGFSATVLDSVTGCASHTVLDSGIGYVTTELNIKYVRPIPKGKELFAEGHVLNVSKQLVLSEGKIVDESGKIYALATATCMILQTK
ncbi:MAG: PaaI family thioesterase [Burkholderiales bacterium]|nr:PaaI family thioesterase [Burkholderiales bacterium]